MSEKQKLIQWHDEGNILANNFDGFPKPTEWWRIQSKYPPNLLRELYLTVYLHLCSDPRIKAEANHFYHCEYFFWISPEQEQHPFIWIQGNYVKGDPDGCVELWFFYEPEKWREIFAEHLEKARPGTYTWQQLSDEEKQVIRDERAAEAARVKAERKRKHLEWEAEQERARLKAIEDSLDEIDHQIFDRRKAGLSLWGISRELDLPFGKVRYSLQKQNQLPSRVEQLPRELQPLSRVERTELRREASLSSNPEWNELYLIP